MGRLSTYQAASSLAFQSPTPSLGHLCPQLEVQPLDQCYHHSRWPTPTTCSYRFGNSPSSSVYLRLGNEGLGERVKKGNIFFSLRCLDFEVTGGNLGRQEAGFLSPLLAGQWLGLGPSRGAQLYPLLHQKGGPLRLVNK